MFGQDILCKSNGLIVKLMRVNKMDQTILISHVEKPEKFKGSDFRHWKQKMLFCLTSLHVSYVLTDSKSTDPYLVDGENVPAEAQMADYEKATSQ
nr:hypothetical protein CTI12_AA498670 [Tanacetum cinerariifolium]